MEDEYTAVFEEKRTALNNMVVALANENESLATAENEKALNLDIRGKEIRENVKSLVKLSNPSAETNDKDYIFMTFVMDHLPIGMIGLLFAVMFSAAMSSTASELNALASTTTVDLYKRSLKKDGDPLHYLKSSRWFTLLWGLLAIAFATYASLFENLIQAVNLLGSLFYGSILGIFLVAFYFKAIKSHAVFIAALLAEACVLYIHYINATDTAPEWLQMGYLWYNVVGCGLVILFGYALQLVLRKE